MVEQFILQTENLPIDDWDHDTFDKTLNDAFLGSDESVNVLNLAINTLAEKIKTQETQIAQNKKDEEELKKPKPQPKAGPVMGSCPTRIARPGGGYICGAER
jgi:uncharacterized protein with von Willebrand factor type A (vWA) domain